MEIESKIKAGSEQRRRRKGEDRGRGNRREERDGGEQERKGKGKREGEIKGKVGRPRRVDIIDRERSMSECGTKSMEKYIKRKRKSEKAKEEGEEEGEAFKGLHLLENFFYWLKRCKNIPKMISNSNYSQTNFLNDPQS